ncbi:MAG: transglycosylase family protein [Acidimicrobiales bacterium]|nr:transglycosylase family protein [Acidimicrobiales bacterium]
MSPTFKPRRSRTGRRILGLATGALAATAAVALPALGQSDGDQLDPVTINDVTASAALAEPPRELIPEEQVVQWHAHATPEERAAFLALFMTPEERAAFALFVASPEQREAFVQFVSPPPPPPSPASRSSSAQPAANPSRSGSSGTNGFLQCVKNRESRGDYGAVNRSSGAAGAYQFMPSTWNATARHAGRPDLVGRNPATVSPADQDAMAMHLYQWQGAAPWGGGC